MSLLLPPLISLQSPFNQSFLTYTDDSYSSTHGYVRFNGGNIFSSFAKFEVLSANTGTGLVHLRCHQNGKFLRRIHSTSEYISPDAAEPDEDQGKWSCTLFRPIAADASYSYKIYLFHVQTQQYAIAIDQGAEGWSLKLNSTLGYGAMFHFTDVESLVILPNHVAIKGPNGKYLKVGATTSENPTFTSTDGGIAQSWFETSVDNVTGAALIKSFHNNKYLRYSTSAAPYWILADATEPIIAGLASSFWPTKVSNSIVAFKSGNTKFCSHRTSDGITDGFSASNTSIDSSCRFTLEELVLSRKIYDTDFDLKNARIYGETPKAMATANASNNSSAENTVQLKITYKETVSSTWTSSHSWMVGVSVTATFKVPFIGGTEVTASAEYNDSYEWGETVTTESTIETTYTATVPPYSSITVRLLATEGTCDVRYSYYQRDMLFNGQTVVYKKDDGVCTGINSYNFHYEVTTVKNLEPGADPTVEYPTTVQKIPLPELSGPTKVQTLVTPAASTGQAEEIVQDAAALPLQTNQDGGETVA